MNEPKLTRADEHEGRALERVKLGVLVGRIVGGFVGCCLGITLGAWTGWSAAPIILAMLGIGAGVSFSDIVGTFTSLDRLYTVLVGAALGFYVGVVFGNSRER